MLRSLLSITGLQRDDYIFPTVDPKEDGIDCKKDCADCTIQYPSKVKVETSRPLYGHIKQFHTHILVATGKSDWKEKVENETGSLMEAIHGSSGSQHGRMMVSASNLTPLDAKDGEPTGKGTTVLLLPSFTFVDSVSPNDITELINHFIDAPLSSPGKSITPPADSRLKSRPCEYDHVVLLCSHKRRDARCGITAPLIKRELERHLRTKGLYRDADDGRPGGVGIFFVSHVGGHKFSANVLVYRRKEQQMIWLARVRPEHCEGIVNYTLLQGKVVHPDSQLRGGFDRMRGLTSW
ncbi:sucrase/ferredoxin-like domain-containing protein [Aspergillus lucknowensis]|uniref:Sucrase/ferredoxin-like-domain-containing protein n=1 Tax=Aspergillus lucknowensis TaxID=176173 RepID=A0ABR4LMW1_9EURO